MAFWCDIVILRQHCCIVWRQNSCSQHSAMGFTWVLVHCTRFWKKNISFGIFRPLFSIIYQVIYYVFICFSFPILKKSSTILQKYWLTFFLRQWKKSKREGKKSNPWIFSFPVLKKGRRNIKTEGRSGKNDKDSRQLFYGTTVDNWAKKRKFLPTHRDINIF